MGHQESQGLNALSPVRGGTGSAELAPPWSRAQVKWLGRGYYVLRLATEETSRWLLGANVRVSDVLPHERTFRRSATDKCELMRKLKMNPWPSHLAAQIDASAWRAGLSRACADKTPVFDTGYVTLWRLAALPAEVLPHAPLVVLDGHHSRRAQINLGLKKLLAWIEPLVTPHLRVRAIERAGWLAKWLDELAAEGELRRLAAAPEPSSWTMKTSLAFEVVQGSQRWWAELERPEQGETAIDALTRLAKGRVFLKSTANFDEVLGWLERFEVDTGLRLPPPTKSYVWERALARQLFPQKATYFHPKVPFGILVEDFK